ncbi:MAG: class I SAM-dependent methyltransferase [Bryobacterales bacterium]|nr:class I SAM-dependent methyltransferase [Bryobacterales bacterium]
MAGLPEQMRDDWNRRAEEDAHYYVAFGRRGQDEAEFLETAADVVRYLEPELRRLPPAPPRARRALEIGCGPGRLMLPMSRHFGEIHGVDVSDRMIALARERLAAVPHAHAHHTSGADLAPFADDSFDFVYSYAVFQHIPSREIVFQYLEECRRVLKTGGILRCQINGLPQTAALPNTWEGVRIEAREAADFALRNDFQVLALEGAGTQYLWTTWRKRPRGWRDSLRPPETPPARLRGFGNTYTGEPLVPSRGRYACVSLWMEGLPRECGLNHLEVRIGGQPGMPSYLGPPVWDGVSQLNVALPAGAGDGLARVETLWLGRRLCEDAWIRIVPPGPAVPLLYSVADGVNLVLKGRTASRLVKLTLEEIGDPSGLGAAVDGLPVEGLEWFPVDASTERYEVNFRLPESIGPGRHAIQVRLGRRTMAPAPIEVL